MIGWNEIKGQKFDTGKELSCTPNNQGHEPRLTLLPAILSY